MASLKYLVKDFFIKKMKKNSFEAHNSEFISEWKLEVERAAHKHYNGINQFNIETVRFHDTIMKFPGIQIAIDIWSGSGYFSDKLTEYFSIVYWIEPSTRGVEIAKELTQNDKITWINKFAEEWLLEIVQKYDEPIFFLASTVLSHLDDAIVIPICKVIDSAPIGSVFAFSEVFGNTKHKHLWHIRSEDWWQSQFPNWEIDFYGPKVKYSILWATCNKGFYGKKLR